MLRFNEGGRFLDLAWPHEGLRQNQRIASNILLILVLILGAAPRGSLFDVLLPSLLMLFKDGMRLFDVTQLTLNTVFVLEEARVELWQASERQRVVEIAQQLGIDLSYLGLIFLRILRLFLDVKPLDFNLNLICHFLFRLCLLIDCRISSSLTWTPFANRLTN